MQRKKLVLTLVELLVVMGIIGLLVALIIPATRTAREPARRNQCHLQLKQISFALQDYEEKNGTLPPAYTVDAEGNRLHSWRTLLLPYIEEAALFETIDLSKPWDDPVNAKAYATVVEAYLCPSSPREEYLTNYLGVFGPNCAFSGSVPRKLSEVIDGLETTIAVIDVNSDHAVHWMSPHDASEDVALGFTQESRMNHPGIMLAAFLDGSVSAISLEIDSEDLWAMMTIAGGEVLVP